MKKSFVTLVVALAIVVVAACSDVVDAIGKCGGSSNIKCSGDQICDITSPERACKQSELEGKCIAVPLACDDDDASVCGCDGKTYRNDCRRRQAMTQLDHGGGC